MFSTSYYTEDRTRKATLFPQNRFKNAQASATHRQRRKNWGTSNTPNYNGATPQKDFTGRYAYDFLEWEPSIGAAVSNTTYTATYTESVAQNYSEWAEARGFGGSDERTGGIENLLRYIFGIIDGESTTLLLSIDVDNGKKMISMPALVNTESVLLKVISTDDLEKWDDGYVSERIIISNEDIPAVFDDDSEVRFYRLKAEEVGD